MDDFAPRLSFFWNAHNNLFEEVAKFRAARRLWAKLMRERIGATTESSKMRFHTQTAGSTLTAQQPENNIVRTTVQALAATLGGTQSLHTNAFDEALGLPTERSATIALRTQQILAAESGVTDTADPLAGSFYVEALTDEVERLALELIEQVEEMGGAVAAIEEGFVQRQIEDSAYREARRIEDASSVVVGVNRFVDADHQPVPLLEIDPRLEADQVARLTAVRERRHQPAVDNALSEVAETAAGGDNLLPPMSAALRLDATLGEVSDVLRKAFGTYRPG